MSLRLFAALPVPVDLHATLARLQKGIPGAAWRPSENFHITLRFFGDIPETMAEDLDAELANIAAKGFELRLKGAGWFGREEPRALWVGVDGGDALLRLQEKCERAARKAGLDPDKRKYTPHMTMAYCRGTPAEKAANFQKRLAGFETEAFRVTHFSLYSSWIRRGDANIYESLADYPLA